MAYDKVIDSAALEAALKASADAIRGKTGGSGSIPWDAVKGFAEAIAAIEAGGGSGGDINGAKYVCGSFTPESDITSNYEIEHETLPKGDITRDVFFIWCSYDTMLLADGSWGKSRFLWGAQVSYKHPTAGTENAFGVIAYTTSSGAFNGTTYVPVRNETQPAYASKFTFSASSSYKLSAGTKYYWLRMQALD